MTLPDYTVEYKGHIYEDNIGPIMNVTLNRVKKRLFWFDKKIVKNAYFWRPVQMLLDEDKVKYIAYGNNNCILGNLWFRVLNDDTTPKFVNGFPDISLLRHYHISKVFHKSKLSNELTKLYNAHQYDYIFKPNSKSK